MKLRDLSIARRHIGDTDAPDGGELTKLWEYEYLGACPGNGLRIQSDEYGMGARSTNLLMR